MLSEGNGGRRERLASSGLASAPAHHEVEGKLLRPSSRRSCVQAADLAEGKAAVGFSAAPVSKSRCFSIVRSAGVSGSAKARGGRTRNGNGGNRVKRLFGETAVMTSCPFSVPSAGRVPS